MILMHARVDNGHCLLASYSVNMGLWFYAEMDSR